VLFGRSPSSLVQSRRLKSATAPYQFLLDATRLTCYGKRREGKGRGGEGGSKGVGVRRVLEGEGSKGRKLAATTSSSSDTFLFSCLFSVDAVGGQKKRDHVRFVKG